MITTKSNKAILVGGHTRKYGGNGGIILNTLLELNNVSSTWKEIKVPLKKLRYGHIAFEGTKELMKVFCGKGQ